jgi:AAA15 family ATPase/GTPase
MDFQIKKLILWPKKEQYDFKEIEFKLNQINIITGASRTGKSAIIPIIDYCLGSGSCYIPVKTIRNACSWFGILISSNGKEILLARKEPGLQKSTDDMFLLEGKSVEIPSRVIKNTTRQNVKRFLDETAKLSFLDIDADTNNQFFGRPSFRDLMAFCFQPQNIVANANTLFYKADTTEHRTKLINIFPYILGAVTPEILAKRQQINDLSLCQVEVCNFFIASSCIGLQM